MSFGYNVSSLSNVLKKIIRLSLINDYISDKIKVKAIIMNHGA